MASKVVYYVRALFDTRICTPRRWEPSLELTSYARHCLVKPQYDQAHVQNIHVTSTRNRICRLFASSIESARISTRVAAKQTGPRPAMLPTSKPSAKTSPCV